MNEIRCTLLSEGTSDRALLPVLSWLLKVWLPEYAIQAEWADLSRLPKPPKLLSERIQLSMKFYPCNILFVHRDADNQGRAQRVSEITKAVNEIEDSKDKISFLICVIPVRMTEAWLLFDEAAIRMAADNPQGKQSLNLPNVGSIDQHPNPKSLLHGLLEEASGVSGRRRLKKFKARMGERAQRISEVIEDFSPLRKLEAFQALETEIKSFVSQKSND